MTTRNETESAARVLSARYELRRSVAVGGMAEVYEAFDRVLKRRVAVKLLRNDLASEEGFVERFRIEAHAAGSLTHPNIVAVYDSGEDSGDLFIVMEFVEGESLRQILARSGRMRESEALKVVAEVAGALAYSHTQGVVHRDVKPANIMISKAGVVKVLDFGIARTVESAAAVLTRTATTLGTAQYLSPEQARGRQVDERSDVYSLGCVLYELLAGRPPFSGEAVSVAYRHAHEDPTPLSEMVRGVDPEVAAIAAKALRKDPEERYQSAAAMRADALNVLAGRTAVASALPVAPVGERIPVVVDEEGPLLVRRRTIWPWVVAGLLVLLLVGFFILKSLLGGISVGVPNVVGMGQGEALTTIQKAGLTIGGISQVSSDRPVGQVVSEDPGAGVKVHQGSAVSLGVSSGPLLLPAPGNLSVRAGDASAALTWDGVPGATGYYVYQGQTRVGTANQTSFTVANLQNGTSYSLSVAAFNQSGEGTRSPSVGVTPSAAPSPTPSVSAGPSAPRSLTATAGSGSVALSWKGSGESFTVYQDGTAVKKVTGNSTTISGLTNGASYTFQVTATVNKVESGPSNSASATPSAPAPGAPSGLAATGGVGSIHLTWSGSGDTFNVYRDGALVATSPSTSYTDTVLGSHTYQVSAVVGGVESAKSNSATASASAAPTPAPSASPTPASNPTAAPSGSPTSVSG